MTIRRYAALSAVTASIALLTLSGTGCKRHRNEVHVQRTEEEGPRLASTVNAADPRSASQLLSGFHEVEQNSWRWTAGKFSVLLRPPRGAGESGAKLVVKFSVVDAVLDKLKSVTLSAKIGNTELAPETYSKSGEYTYTRDVDGKLLQGDSVKVDFTLDKSIPPTGADQRELGVVFSSAGLEAK